MNAREFNFDGLVGPTHNYAGLSYGNVASQTHQQQVSNPRAAALQGLRKMRANFELGLGQAMLPPLPRPFWPLFRQLGFEGTQEQMLAAAWAAEPILAATVYSASNMWTANAATVSPSPDCGDGRLHLTPANLSSTLHRSIEANHTAAILKFVFADASCFEVHDPLPAGTALTDEGAANHTRLCHDYGHPGLEIFTFGRSAFDADRPRPPKFPARQTLEACQAIARRHGLRSENVLLVQQNPEAIDAGVFHNDVIAVGNQDVLLVHERAFVEQTAFLEKAAKRFEELTGASLHVVEIPENVLPLGDAVSSYLFNSQILSLPDRTMVLVCPSDCQTNAAAQSAIELVLGGENPLTDVRYFDLRQSMNNGGGPACLRLRVVLTENQVQRIHPGILFREDSYERLGNWITDHYREALHPDDLRDPALPGEVQHALIALESLLQLPSGLLVNPC